MPPLAWKARTDGQIRRHEAYHGTVKVAEVRRVAWKTLAPWEVFVDGDKAGSRWTVAEAKGLAEAVIAEQCR